MYRLPKNPFIESLELSVRASNVLRRSGLVNTPEEFMALDRETFMLIPQAGVRTWKEIEQVQKYLGSLPHAAPAPAQDQDVVFAPSALPERMFNETRRHMQRIEFYQGRQAAALETVAQAQITAEPAMALRDAAALAALQSILARCFPSVALDQDLSDYVDDAARLAWSAADAFMAAREGKSE
jgi:hypothetical protein